jgi:membrane protein implicated in regulation of membrane protease activity
LAGAAFLAGAFLAVGADLLGLVFVAVAFLAGALVADFAVFAAVFVWLVVFLRAVEDTNTSRQDCLGAARPGMVKSRAVILPWRW